ncbi:MAG: sigma-54 dependent transcriptional regulator [Candidatus Krumholzibacteriia bacterium]|nr:sigma-54-dependent Fis family transcriptional regulator [bacterium]MCB9516125.1 sigma-54-dependent Fis family transcriptional regulator [Candidatus Latescibacterota bacterium]
MHGRLLIVDDERSMLDLLRDDLGRRGFRTHCAESAEAALDLLESEDVDVVLTDMHLPQLDGIAFCRHLADSGRELPVIVMTGFGSIDAAVSAMRAGAYDFITKPVSLDILALALERAVERRRLTEQVKRLSESERGEPGRETLIGESPVMRRLRALVARVAETEATVLVTGESGTGKELVARMLHERSHRARGPFQAVNCAALPGALMESELFGHRPGAFTDARAPRAGLFQQASGGTLFLDEVGELPAELQPKLLRALETRRIRPLGAERELEVDVRLVAATNSDLEAAVAAGRFREDLYYRLNVIRVEVPPLRERGADILLLARHFAAQFARAAGRPAADLAPAAARRLLEHGWPGNVRELRNGIERAVALADGESLTVGDLPAALRSPQATPGLPEPERLLPLATVERRYIAQVLEITKGNRSAAARILGLDRKTLWRKLGAATPSEH